MKKPAKHCGMGTHEHAVCMPIKGCVQDVDLCLSHIVAALNAANIKTTWSCCGHGELHGVIGLEDGRHLVVIGADEFVQEMCDKRVPKKKAGIY